MTHLRIEQNNSVIEQVSGAVITKLYELASSGLLDLSSNLVGRLHTTATYLLYIDYLQGQFDGTNNKGPLYIDATKKYIIFADPEVQRVLLTLYGDGTGITREDMSSVTSLALNLFKNNTVITSFDELGQFPSIIQIKYDCFSGATNLLSIDLSNIEQLGNNAFKLCALSGIINVPLLKIMGSLVFTANAYITEVNIGSLVPDQDKITLLDGTFNGCSSLTKVTGLKKVSDIGATTFYGTDIQYLDFEVPILHLGRECFKDCTKILCIDLSAYEPWTGNIYGMFNGCTGLIDLSTYDTSNINTGSATYTFNWDLVPLSIFRYCTSLNKAFVFPNATTIGADSFNQTKITSLSAPNATYVGANCFYNCSDLTTVNISNSNVSVGNLAFKNCSKLESTNPISITVSTTTQGSDTYEVFYGCSELTSVILTGLDLSIGDSFFRDCTKLSSVQGLDKIKYLSGHAFFNNPLLTGELNFSNLVGRCTRNAGSVIPTSYGFFYNVGATKIHMPSWDLSFLDLWGTYSGRAFFISCPNLKEVLIHIPDNGFPNYRSGGRSVLFESCPSMERLIINNTSVASLKNTSDVVDLIDIGGSNVTLYVPDNLVNDYKTASGWSNIASNIKGMSELPSS